MVDNDLELLCNSRKDPNKMYKPKVREFSKGDGSNQKYKYNIDEINNFEGEDENFGWIDSMKNRNQKINASSDSIVSNRDKEWSLK